jgi:hypothetical protein
MFKHLINKFSTSLALREGNLAKGGTEEKSKEFVIRINFFTAYICIGGVYYFSTIYSNARKALLEYRKDPNGIHTIGHYGRRFESEKDIVESAMYYSSEPIKIITYPTYIIDDIITGLVLRK